MADLPADEREATGGLGGPQLAGFIQKPYVATALLSKVREAIEG